MKRLLSLICTLLCANVLLAQTTFTVGNLTYEIINSNAVSVYDCYERDTVSTRDALKECKGLLLGTLYEIRDTVPQLLSGSTILDTVYDVEFFLPFEVATREYSTHEYSTHILDTFYVYQDTIIDGNRIDDTVIVIQDTISFADFINNREDSLSISIIDSICLVRDTLSIIPENARIIASLLDIKRTIRAEEHQQGQKILSTFYIYGVEYGLIPHSVTHNGRRYTVTSIRDLAFSNCHYLNKIYIPNTITSIGRNAFYNCYNLDTVYIPNSVTSIGEFAFQGCDNLTHVTLPQNATISNTAFFEAGKETAYFKDNDGLKYQIIPLNEIENYNFYNCGAITFRLGNNTYAPNEVMVFPYESNALENALTIKDIVNIPLSRNSSYEIREHNETIYTTNNNYYPYLENSCVISDNIIKHTIYIANDTILVIKESNDTIIKAQYTNDTTICINNDTIYISNNTIYIGNETIHTENDSIYRFEFNIRYWEKIENYIERYYPVTKIKEYAFENYRNLPSVTIPNTITYIGENAFSGCSRFETISIPKNVSHIGRSAFENCSNLTTLNYNAINIEEFEKEDYYQFKGCPISSINIGDSVQKIPNNFAYNLDSLTSITIPNTTISIGRSAFENCSNLASVTCLSLIPPQIEDSLTFKYTRENKTLYVPCGSFEAYTDTTDNVYWEAYFYKIQDDCGNVGLYDVNSEELTFYPNPTSGKVTFNQMIEQIDVIDITGKNIETFSNTYEINIETLKSGVYYLRLLYEDKVMLKKLIKQ